MFKGHWVVLRANPRVWTIAYWGMASLVPLAAVIAFAPANLQGAVTGIGIFGFSATYGALFP